MLELRPDHATAPITLVIESLFFIATLLENFVFSQLMRSPWQAGHGLQSLSVGLLWVFMAKPAFRRPAGAGANRSPGRSLGRQSVSASIGRRPMKRFGRGPTKGRLCAVPFDERRAPRSWTAASGVQGLGNPRVTGSPGGRRGPPRRRVRPDGWPLSRPYPVLPPAVRPPLGQAYGQTGRRSYRPAGGSRPALAAWLALGAVGGGGPVDVEEVGERRLRLGAIGAAAEQQRHAQLLALLRLDPQHRGAGRRRDQVRRRS